MTETNPYSIHQEPWYTLWAKMHYLGIRWQAGPDEVWIDNLTVCLGDTHALSEMSLEDLASKIDEARKTAQSGQGHS